MKLVINISDDHKRVIDNLVADGNGYLLPYEVENQLAKSVKIGAPLTEWYKGLIKKIETDMSWDMVDDWGNFTALHDELVNIIEEYCEEKNNVSI